MTGVLVDTNVLVYAIGGPHRYAEPCREVLRLAARGALTLEAPVDLITELVHQRLRRTGDRGQAIVAGRAAQDLCVLHPVGPVEIETALTLFENHEGLGARDAVFAAVGRVHGLRTVISADHDLDGVDGLSRVDPLEAGAVAELIR